MLKELPEKGELVVCTVSKAKGFGAFVELEEFPNKKGFIHIKEVSSGWVKNIREYVREGQRIVCKVMDTDISKGYVDLSLKRVNEHQKREKIQQWKNEQKANKLLEMLANKINMNSEECYEKYGNKLVEKFGNLYNAFEEVANDTEILTEKEYPSDFIQAFIEHAKENIVIPYVEIKGYIEMSCPCFDGVKHIKKALSYIDGEKDNISISVKYLSAPIYRIEIQAPEYKPAEKHLKSCIEKSIKHIENHGGTGKFMRELK